ncbi:MAG: FHA domain-containing protein, partial [Planctomycetes bacterium]|nr:FHA domain-containing protein [Planctomycetota bacterium]
SAQALAEDLRRFRAASTSGKGASQPARPVAGPALITTAGQQFSLRAPVTVIGRSPESDIVLKDPHVSVRHCQIRGNADRLVVEDLQSQSGTYVNGFAVETCPLEDGDELRIGSYGFRVRVPGHSKVDGL